MTDTAPRTGSKACPVHFDNDTPEHARQWAETYRKLREDSPRAWSETHGGFWVATELADIVGLAQRSDAFSVHKEFDPDTGEVRGGILIPPVKGFRGIPNEADSPEWDGIRGFVNRRFSPRSVELRREKAQRLAAGLIDLVIERGKFDIVDDLTSPLPALVTMDVFGFPLEEWRSFSDPFHVMAYSSPSTPGFAERTGVFLDFFFRRVDEEVALRRKEPQDDFLTHLAIGTIDGVPLSHEQIHDLAFNIMAGGVDTTTSLTSNTLLYLARNPEKRQQLIDNPGLMPLACEEFVRFFTPVQALARNARDDVEVNGWQFDKGDRVLLAYAAGNRDPAAFDEPDEVKLDRFPNKHIGFGAGMHRCLGSFLARLMFQVMVSEVLTRMPDYRVIEEEAEPYHTIAKVNGWIRIPATFTPGPKVGAVIG